MNLKDVLSLFNEDILAQIEKIEYLTGPDDFAITAYFEEDKDNWQDITIWLFGNGETCLKVNDPCKMDYIMDEAIDFYLNVRDTWKNNV